MISLAAKLSRTTRNGLGPSFSLLKPSQLPPRKSAAPPPNRYFYANNSTFIANPVALEMINYAMSLARAQKTEDSYGRGLLVLDQCESTQPDDNSKGLVELARSTLLFERGSYEAAIERLERIQDLSLPSVAIKVAASEALVGLYLEHYEEDAASVVADIALQLLETIRLEIGNGSGFEVLEARVKALKGLVELICGNLDSAQSFFEGARADGCCIGNAALSYGEFLHGMRKFSDAKELYQKVIQGMSEIKDFGDPNNLGASNMTSEEVVVAATCSLGQLEAHMGNFSDAEEMLTATLKKTEDRFGSQHPKVGVILTCIALMYRHKAAMEHSSSLLIQEGLYRKAIELLKAPPLQIDGASEKVHRKDIIALARGGYAETLRVQQSRKAEGEKLKHWAETAWRNRWMSLAEALELSESSPKVPVIDTRICRAV
ncbi:Tetratricopeptide repeat (TPR)-like superfamily protein [Forsythia ovata]|uniref:Tetratricopeptide repeat (TPR)-like superfamily protein n=1 Tax=Forsythia ovata TaxID=205694 RepID=A0ABD1SR12_9LAMI